MNSFLSTFEFAGILIAILITLLFVLFLQIRNSLSHQRLSAPIVEYIETKAEAKAKEIIDAAKKTADERLAAVAKEAVAVKELHEHNVAKVVDELVLAMKEQASTLQSRSDQALSAQINLLQGVTDETKTKVTQLQETLTAEQETVASTTQEVTAAMSAMSQEVKQVLTTKVDGAATAFADHLDSYDQRFSTTIAQETKRLLAAINEDMEAYKTQRRDLLDAHVAQIVEQVTKEVLHKQLTVAEHAQLAKQALASVQRKEII